MDGKKLVLLKRPPTAPTQTNNAVRVGRQVHGKRRPLQIAAQPVRFMKPLLPLGQTERLFKPLPHPAAQPWRFMKPYPPADQPVKLLKPVQAAKPVPVKAVKVFEPVRILKSSVVEFEPLKPRPLTPDAIVQPVPISETPLWIKTMAKIDLLRLKLDSKDNQTSNEIMRRSSKLRGLYKDLIMLDLEEGIKRKLENQLWVDCFKHSLAHLKEAHDMKAYDELVGAGMTFYRGFGKLVRVAFDPAYAEEVSSLLKQPIRKSRVDVELPPIKAVQFMIQNSLMHIGDLLGCRSDYKEALKMYEKARAAGPIEGYPYNQLGMLTALVGGNSAESLLLGIYYQVKAITVPNPFKAAEPDLQVQLRMINGVGSTSQEERFILTFLTALANLDAVSMQTDTITQILLPMIAVQSVSCPTIFRTLIIGIYFWKEEEENPKVGTELEVQPRQTNILKVVVSMLNGIMSGMFLTKDLLQSPYLAYLKLWLDFIRLNLDVLHTQPFIKKFDYGTLCKLGNRFLDQQHVVPGPKADVQMTVRLPEEGTMIEFIPMAPAYAHLSTIMPYDEPRCVALRVKRILKSMMLLHVLGYVGRRMGTGHYLALPAPTQLEPGVSPLTGSPKQRSETPPSIRRSLGLIEIPSKDPAALS